VKNCEEIAAVDGVDCLWVGHFDLSVGLGIPGEFEHPDFKAAIDRTVKAARSHGKAMGRLVPTVEVGIELYDVGFDFICYSGDVWVLHNALAEAIGKLREGTKANASKNAAAGSEAAAKAAAPAKAKAPAKAAPAKAPATRKART
jgi:2-dehydro-3-deoxyglucarate aldolase/4-hydroxy-2-oxoheptanedioate aldolase